MIFDDETKARTGKAQLRILDNLSVKELKEYIVELQDEILRVEKDISKKDSQKNVADSFFKT